MEASITGKTGLLALLGSPVAHSISPLMHNESFRFLDLDYVYLCFDVNTNTLSAAVEGLKTIGIKGFNCTMPNKNLICELVDELSPAAKMIGAVNTVVNVNGTLTGYNTDGVGYMMSVKEAGHDIIGKKMTVLGNGGAATAICVQAALDGVGELSVFSRKTRFWERAAKLVDEINQSTSCRASLFDYDSHEILKEEVRTSQMLTNATSVGMGLHEDACLIPDSSFFHDTLIVSDVIYTPRETKLLRMARESGCTTFNGLHMLLFQGAEAFRLWTNKEMPVEHIKCAIFQGKSLLRRR